MKTLKRFRIEYDNTTDTIVLSIPGVYGLNHTSKTFWDIVDFFQTITKAWQWLLDNNYIDKLP